MRNYIEFILLIVILSAFGYAVWDYNATKAENKRLTTELTNANITITALDEIAKKKQAIQQKTDGLIDEIEKEPETNDADTAPVLYNSIMRMH